MSLNSRGYLGDAVGDIESREEDVRLQCPIGVVPHERAAP